MGFEGKVAWVTGASSGIGAALTEELSVRGATVILSGRRMEALEAVRARLPGPALILPFEATDFDALPDIVARAFAWKPVDLLVNNAGVTQRSLAIDTTLDVYRQLMEVDYFAPVRLTQLVLPHMVARRGGHLAAVTSMAGKVGGPLRTGYAAAKHACGGYFDALRAEIEIAYGIRVSVILPGAIATPIAFRALSGDGSNHDRPDPLPDAGMPTDQAARIIADGLAAGCREILVGSEREHEMLRLRAEEPDRLFDLFAQLGAQMSAARTHA